MEKIKEFLEKYGTILLIGLSITLLFKTCSLQKEFTTYKKQSSKSIDSLNDKVSKLATEDFIVESNKVLLYDFLVFEDDIDKKKISFSDVKLKLKK
jgi:hypothetical protein